MYREHRFSVPESKRFDPTKIQPSFKLSPNEFAMKIREWMGTAEETSSHQSQHKRQFDRETSRLSTYTQRSVADELRLKILDGK